MRRSGGGLALWQVVDALPHTVIFQGRRERQGVVYKELASRA